jgi:soluble lytic murein transglycosylase
MNRSSSVYGRLAAAVIAAVVAWAVVPPVAAQSGNDTVLEARDAFRKKNSSRLAAARAAAQADRHALLPWVEYWELTNRLASAQQDEINAFYTRWSGTYVEDRLRNDWLLELGRRRDWANFAIDYPRFRMNDDREVTCYALLTEHLAGRDVRDAARGAWLAQRDADAGCALMAQTLYDAGKFTDADVWLKARRSVDANRPAAARQAVALMGAQWSKRVADALDAPPRYLARHASAATRSQAEMAALALIGLADKDPEMTATLLADRWERDLPADLAAWAWASVGREAAQNLSPQAPAYFQRAAKTAAKSKQPIEWSDDTLAWKARAALRSDGAARWPQVLEAIGAMSADEQRDAAWVYWRARALQATASDPKVADPEATRLLESIAGELNFYGSLAAEDLGRPIALAPEPAPLTAQERAAAVRNPGLSRALLLISIGLRSEGVREWNFTLRGMQDRELLAAAQLACDMEVWDRCINTSDRTRTEIDMAQRFPMPFRKDVVARAREIGLDPAYVYGLIRQESRFIMDAKSGAGASGLMQIMPATAKWTAKKIGMDHSAVQLHDKDANLRLGTAYLKLVLDDFAGSQPLAAAAYNAGPGRSRRWRDGPTLESAIWAENIPFGETRDYVKKVLSNAAYYEAMLSGSSASLKKRLGPAVGPKDASPTLDKELP